MRLTPRAMGWFVAAAFFWAVPVTRAQTAAFDAIPATTNQANLHLDNGSTVKNGTMTMLSGSVLVFEYDGASHVLTLHGATLLGSNVQFTFGGAYHPCVVGAKVVADENDPHFPFAGAIDAATGNFAMWLNTNFTGKVGNDCASASTPFSSSADVVIQGKFTKDAGTGAMSVTDIVTQQDFGPIELTFSGVTLDLTGSIQLNVSSTAPGTIFTDGFESGETSEWSITLGGS